MKLLRSDLQISKSNKKTIINAYNRNHVKLNIKKCIEFGE